VIDVASLCARWADGPLAPWAERLPEQVAAGLSAKRYGDLPRWRAALARLPAVVARHAAPRSRRGHRGKCERDRCDVACAQLEEALRALHPWRKGPYELFGIGIDTEWRSDWKWSRLAPHIAPLAGRRVLDVGCGNGYHVWRMRGAGAAEVVGIDPSPLFVAQFAALQHYLRDPAACVLPMGVEAMPPDLAAFDTAFSMGVLYHRRNPLEHLQVLRDCLRPGGQLILETLVIEGDEQRCLVPEGRYARMGNVWFLPSSALLLRWLERLGWRDARVVDESVTTTQEQRRTDWMRFHSLAEFLDPEDSTKTDRGLPRATASHHPRRALSASASFSRRGRQGRSRVSPARKDRQRPFNTTQRSCLYWRFAAPGRACPSRGGLAGREAPIEKEPLMHGTADIGLIGLAVMGQNLVLNMNDHGFTVAVYNRTRERTDAVPRRAGGGHGM
jgi:tRNA (mo5U34)-methyltransferase